MVRFRDVSIRRKLLLINVFTTGIALVLASTAFVSYERVGFEQDVTRQLSMVADVTGANARPALASQDHAAGEAVLLGLRSNHFTCSTNDWVAVWPPASSAVKV